MRIDERAGTWLIVATLTATLTATTVAKTLRDYRDLKVGWSWDLAYYNQSIWSVTHGDGLITARPIGPLGIEGPSAWRSMHLGPIRLAMIPFYLAFPDPRTILVFAGVIFWWTIPAAFTLARSESGSDRAALSAVGLVALSPLLWPMAWNDFREIQAGIPFVLWAYQGVRSRRPGLTAAAVAGMLACRQEFAVVVAALAFLPAREDEDVGRKARWRLILFDVGLGWILVYFVYLKLVVGRNAPEQYVDQFLGPRPTLAQTLETLRWVVRDGLGAWSALALLAPVAALLAAPWIWSLGSGRWAMRMLFGPSWHHVRYTAPALATAMAAGLIGYARLAARLKGRRGGAAILAVVWLAAAGWSAFGLRETLRRMGHIPRPVDAADVEPFWAWAGRVGPDDAVLASYEFSAPLSSRKALYSHVLTTNQPQGYPRLGPEIRWIFWRLPERPEVRAFREQGYEEMYRGPSLVVLHRP
ncbi:MAG: hypothetical protein BGO49_25660 [Planctomycetales bacterium 71-10]|nr:MAG: hypothetical protein BGO49_25660 [Planctomycetales bacterium 71-10]